MIQWFLLYRVYVQAARISIDYAVETPIDIDAGLAQARLFIPYHAIVRAQPALYPLLFNGIIIFCYAMHLTDFVLFATLPDHGLVMLSWY